MEFEKRKKNTYIRTAFHGCACGNEHANRFACRKLADTLNIGVVAKMSAFFDVVAIYSLL